MSTLADAMPLDDAPGSGGGGSRYALRLCSGAAHNPEAPPVHPPHSVVLSSARRARVATASGGVTATAGATVDGGGDGGVEGAVVVDNLAAGVVAMGGGGWWERTLRVEVEESQWGLLLRQSTHMSVDTAEEARRTAGREAKRV
eukprot:COSAG05_NODE_1644_length_4351_cov_343.181091_1_plen_144_part_00